MGKKVETVKLNSVPPFLTWSAPTEPVHRYLDIAIKDSEAELCSATISEALRFGTHILEWLNREYSKTKMGEAASLLFAEQLRKIDGLSALFKAGAQASAPIIIRSMVETVLYIKYLMQSDSERRASSLLFMGKIRRLEFLQELQESTASGKRIRDLFSKDATGIILSLGGEGVDEEIEAINQELTEGYPDVLTEYNELRKKRTKQIEWYQLFEGPNELRDLATKVSETAIYYIGYRSFNEHVHGTHVFRQDSYWRKDRATRYSTRPLKADPLFDESFFVINRTFMVALDHIHVNPEFLRDWFWSCKLLGLRGFESFTVSSPDGRSFDFEFA